MPQGKGVPMAPSDVVRSGRPTARKWQVGGILAVLMVAVIGGGLALWPRPEPVPAPAPDAQVALADVGRTSKVALADVGRTKTRVVAATRSLRPPATRSLAPTPPDVWPLVPELSGLSSRESPVLYWYASAPYRGNAHFTLATVAGKDPVLDLDLAGLDKGLNQIDLAQHDVRLQSGVEYRWSLTLEQTEGQAAEPVYAAGGIVYHPGTDLPGDAQALAQAGYWYDALQGAMGDRETQAKLLDGADLADVAKQIRSSS